MLLAACAGSSDDTRKGKKKAPAPNTPTTSLTTVTSSTSSTQATPDDYILSGTSPVTGPSVMVSLVLFYDLVDDDNFSTVAATRGIPVEADGSWAMKLNEPTEDVVRDYDVGTIFSGLGGGQALQFLPVLFVDLDGDGVWSWVDHTIDARITDHWVVWVSEAPRNGPFEEGWAHVDPDVQPSAGQATLLSDDTPVVFEDRWGGFTPLNLESTWTGPAVFNTRMAAFWPDDLEAGLAYDDDGLLETEPVFDVAFAGDVATTELSGWPWNHPNPYELDFFVGEDFIPVAWVLPMVYADIDANGSMALFGEQERPEVAGATICSGAEPVVPLFVDSPRSVNDFLAFERWGVRPGWQLTTLVSARPVFPPPVGLDPSTLTSDPSTCDYFDHAP